MSEMKKNAPETRLKRTQISTCAGAFLTVLSVLFPMIAFAVNGDLEYYGVMLILYAVRIGLLAATLLLTLVSVIELVVLWRKYHSFDHISKAFTISAIAIPLLICGWIIIFQPGT